MEDDDHDMEANQDLDDNLFNDNLMAGITGNDGEANSISGSIERIRQSELTDDRDAQWGFSPLKYNECRQGWLLNIQPVQRIIIIVSLSLLLLL